MKGLTKVALVPIALCSVLAGTARAQSADLPGRVEVSVGAMWVGRQPLSSIDANETTATAGTLRLFSASTELAAAPAFEGRVGVRLARALTAEVQGSYGRPELRIAISNDFEGGAAISAVEHTQQFTVGGGLVWYLPIGSRASRAAPFLTGGGGYLRQLHESATLVATGRYYQIGGGVAVVLRSRHDSRLKATGIRIDARALVRVDGVAFDSKPHTAPVVGGSLFLRF